MVIRLIRRTRFQSFITCVLLLVAGALPAAEDPTLEFLAETLEILESDGPSLLEAIRAACAAGAAAVGVLVSLATANKSLVANC